MTAKGKKPPLALDMPFGEALARFVQTEPVEVEERMRAEKEAKRAAKKKGSARKPIPDS